MHTPGPWRAPSSSYVIGDGVKICQLTGIYVDNPNCVADSRLIAAAPKLLKACKYVIHLLNDPADEGVTEAEELQAKDMLAGAIARATREEES